MDTLEKTLQECLDTARPNLTAMALAASVGTWIRVGHAGHLTLGDGRASGPAGHGHRYFRLPENDHVLQEMILSARK